MLFYHRVEPRTGCWEVSASVSPSVSPYTLLPNVPKGGGQGPWERLVLVLQLVEGALILSNMHPSTVCPLIQLCSAVFILNVTCFVFM